MFSEQDPDEDQGCTLPPPALPPSELKRYRAEADPDAEADIVRYVEIETRDETVQHAERIKTEYALGEAFEIWDVVTDKARWWVLTNLVNLYSQEQFPSLDYVLSFHIGLMMRLRSRPDGAQSDDPTPFDEVLRRQEQAKDRYDRALEPEDFQAVGMQLRECLLSLTASLRRRTQMATSAEHPQDANFTAWYDMLLDELCPGNSNKELRHYLKETARNTWQLVNWLVHDRDANRTAATIAIHGVDATVGHTLSVFMRSKADISESCPRCRSRNVRSHFDPSIGRDGEYYQTCGVCRWTSHPESKPRGV